MSETAPHQPEPDDHNDPTPEDDAPQRDVPRTGEPTVDDALEGLQDLDSAPLDEHHDRLSRVHEDLHRALNPE
jgi:hypothetical protein